jgi:hypothetical protein
MTTNMKKVFKSTKSSPALILEPIKELDPDGIEYFHTFIYVLVAGRMHCTSSYPQWFHTFI